MSYTRGGRPLVKVQHKNDGISVSNGLIVEDLNMEGVTGKIYTKTGTVPRGFFVYRNGKKVDITKEEYEQLNLKKNSQGGKNGSSKV